MTLEKPFERCLAFINCQISPSRPPPPKSAKEQRMTITLSRQTGSGAMEVAEKLAKYMQKQCPSDCPWAVFDRNLMERVLEDHNLPARIAKFLPEDAISGVNDMVDELLGLHPPSWTVIRQTTETILQLAELGNVILIGRGANVITGKLENTLHVRLIAPLEKRIERIQKQNNLSRSKAEDFIRRNDQGRARYLKKYYHQHVEDPLLYDLVLNTDRFSIQEVVGIIGEAVVERAENIR
jgi:cytidylate kinase